MESVCVRNVDWREMCRSMYRGKLRREVYVSYAFENESDVYVH